MARRSFGSTWWGAAWLDALEKRALADPNRLPRGRTYARQDRVVDLELSPGLVQARVWGSDRYATQLSVRLLSDAEWDQVLETVMAQAANAAALLSGEVPKAIGDLVLPDKGDLSPDCSCPDSAEPCKHAAALCYVVADLLDEDPFALLTLRGRGRDEVLAEIRQRRAEALGGEVGAPSDLPRGPDPGVPASAAFKRSDHEAAASRPAPRLPSASYRLGAVAPADSGIDPDALESLVNDAADRAWRMLANGDASGLSASPGNDVVRRAARVDDAERAQIAEVTGLDADELASAAAAWRVGGHAGYRVSRGRWVPTGREMQPGVDALGEEAKVRANTVAAGGVQLRLDETDRNWWRFDADDSLGWVLVAGPATEPADLID
jgi:uncharacterized Zn finger protein